MGGEAGRAHAQKAEAPEQEAEDDAAHGHAADEAGVRKVADYRRIDRAEQRRGQVGQDDRPGELPDTAVPGAAVVARPARTENGSASGRERVWRYGVIQGVTVSLKKKK